MRSCWSAQVQGMPVTILISTGEEREYKQIEAYHPPVPPSTILLLGLDPRTFPIFKVKIKVTLKGGFELLYLWSIGQLTFNKSNEVHWWGQDILLIRGTGKTG